MGKNIKRVYIAGKITGTEDYLERFDAAEQWLREEGFSSINPTDLPFILGDSVDYEDILHICFALIDICDAIYLMEGYKESAGAMREREYAIAKGKIVITKSITES